MFGKLMKYELRGCMRVFLPLWGATLALALINGLTNGFQPSISAPLLRFFLQVLPALLLFGLSFGMFVMAFVLIIRRFFSGLLGDGGYLAFSLPATCSQHIASKLLTALIMLAGCLITGLLATILINYNDQGIRRKRKSFYCRGMEYTLILSEAWTYYFRSHHRRTALCLLYGPAAVFRYGSRPSVRQPQSTLVSRRCNRDRMDFKPDLY